MQISVFESCFILQNNHQHLIPTIRTMQFCPVRTFWRTSAVLSSIPFAFTHASIQSRNAQLAWAPVKVLLLCSAPSLQPNTENSRFLPMCLISCLHPHRKTAHFKQQVFLPTAGSDTQEHLCVHTSCLLYAIWARWIQSGEKAEIRPCLWASVSSRSLKHGPSSHVYNVGTGLPD